MAPRKPKPDKPPLSKIPEMTSSWAGNYTYFATPLSEAEYIQAWNEWVEAAREAGPLTREVWDSFQAKHGELFTADGAKFKPGKVNPTKVRAKPGDPPLKKVRGGRLSATAGEGVNMRNWRGQLAAYITQGTPLSTDSAKHKSDLGDMLEAHHRVGNAEHAPWLDDIIEKLRSSDPKIKAEGVSMVEAGRAWFDKHPIKRPVGNVKENYDFHPRIRHQGLKGKQPEKSVHGITGTGTGDAIEPGYRITGPGGKSQWVHPTTGEPLELAQDIRKLPWTKQETMSWVEQGIYKGKGQKFPRKGGPIPRDFDSQLSRWSTWKEFIDGSNPIREEIKLALEADPTMRTDAEIAAGRRGLSKVDIEAQNTLRQLNGSDAAPRSVGAAGFGAQLAPSSGSGRNIGSKALDVLYETNPENYIALQDLTKAGTTVGRRVSALMPFIGAAGDVWDVTERYKTMMNDPNTGVSDWLDKAQFGIATATVGTTWYAEPVNTVLGLTNLGIDIGRTIVEEDKRKAAGNTLRALGTAGMHSIRDLSKNLW